jgi:hypothetical protein
MNLGHSAIDAPPGPHLSPVQDVLALDVGQWRHTLISVQTETTEQTVQCQASNVHKLVTVAPCRLKSMPVLAVAKRESRAKHGWKLLAEA